jgi:hypothetical protein
MEQRKSKRSVRLALVLGAAVAGTALVGWGGLAAWQAYTQNSGNTFAVGTLTHTNLPKGGVTCDSTNSLTAAEATTATTPCQLIVSGSILTSSWTGVTGSVVITDTGTVPSKFSVSTPPSDDPTGALCSDLSLTVTGADSSTTPFVNQTSIGPLTATTLKTSAGSTSWADNNSNTFTFNVAPTDPSAFSIDNSVPGESCSFDVLFTQASA